MSQDESKPFTKEMAIGERESIQLEKAFHPYKQDCWRLCFFGVNYTFMSYLNDEELTEFYKIIGEALDKGE